MLKSFSGVRGPTSNSCLAQLLVGKSGLRFGPK
jgi:hypothetical protein